MDFSQNIGYIAMLLLKDTNPTWIVKIIRAWIVCGVALSTVYGSIWVANQVWNMTW